MRTKIIRRHAPVTGSYKNSSPRSHGQGNIIFIFSTVLFSLLLASGAFAALTVSPSLSSKSLTENQQVTVSVSVTNTGTSAESNVVVQLAGSPMQWFSLPPVQDCSAITSISAGQSQTTTCIIRPTSVGTDLTLTATAESSGGTTGSGSTGGISVASQSGTLTSSLTAPSSVAVSASFYVGVAVTAPPTGDALNVRTTISASGACTVDTSSVPASQSLGTVTQGTTRSPTSWLLTSSSSSGTCTVTVNVVSDNAGSANPSASITVGTGGGGGDAGGGGGGGGGGTSGGVLLRHIDINQDLVADKVATITLSAGDAALVTLNNENHTIRPMLWTNTSAVIQFSSAPYNLTIKVGDSRDVDLTGDLITDLNVKLLAANSTAVTLLITVLEGAPPITPVAPPKEEAPPAPAGPVCGDGNCENPETWKSCPADCKGLEAPPKPVAVPAEWWIIIAFVAVAAGAFWWYETHKARRAGGK